MYNWLGLVKEPLIVTRDIVDASDVMRLDIPFRDRPAKLEQQFHRISVLRTVHQSMSVNFHITSHS